MTLVFLTPSQLLCCSSHQSGDAITVAHHGKGNYRQMEQERRLEILRHKLKLAKQMIDQQWGMINFWLLGPKNMKNEGDEVMGSFLMSWPPPFFSLSCLCSFLCWRYSHLYVKSSFTSLRQVLHNRKSAKLSFEKDPITSSPSFFTFYWSIDIKSWFFEWLNQWMNECNMETQANSFECNFVEHAEIFHNYSHPCLFCRSGFFAVCLFSLVTLIYSWLTGC